MTAEPLVTWMKVLETSRYLQCSTKTIYRLVKSGALKRGYLGRSIRFRKEDLDAFMKREQEAPDEDADFIDRQIGGARP